MNNQKLIYPKLCIVEISRYCNFHCFMCPHDYIPLDSQGNMSFSTFKKIIDDSCGFIKAYQLYWLGEPLCNSAIFNMIDYLRSKTDANIIVSTNGSLLSEDICRKIINSGINKLYIDVDSGNSSELYSQIRSGGDFFALIHNIDYLLSINVQHSMDITLQFLCFKFNISQLPIFINRWKNKACSLQVDWIDTWANQMPQLIEAAAVISPYAYEQKQPCADIWNRVTINYNGDVNLCCHDYNGSYMFGNINEKNLLDIWNSYALNKIRNEHLNHKFKGLCAHCIEWAKETEHKEFLE